MNKWFPQSYPIVTDLRSRLKTHYFDLVNAIKDVENLAQTVKDRISLTLDKLDLRSEFDARKELDPAKDA